MPLPRWSVVVVVVVVVVVAVGLAVGGCGGTGGGGTGGGGTGGEGTAMADGGLGRAATVAYDFYDSSVPPPYHRSYRLTFDRSGARIVVDSYGELLADRSAPMPGDVWAAVSRTYPAVRTLTVEDPEQGCTGGTGFALTVTEGGAESHSLRGTACGGTNSDVAEALAAWVAPVRALFPPMDQLAPEGQ